MAGPGETDLDAMLASLTASRRPGVFTMVTLNAAVINGDDRPTVDDDGVEAVIVEAEGTTVVASLETAARRGWSGHFTGAWLTLEVHSALEAVGLTAAVSVALAAEGIPANMLAGYFHDHLLVPVDDADRAIAVLGGLG